MTGTTVFVVWCNERIDYSTISCVCPTQEAAEAYIKASTEALLEIAEVPYYE